MKILKRYIFIISAILLVVLLIIATLNKHQKEIEVQEKATIADISGIIDPNLKELDNYGVYCGIEDMMNSYYLYAEEGNNGAVYSLLDKEYTVTNGIQTTNAIEKVSTQIKCDNKIIIDEIYIKQHSLYPVYLIKMKDIANQNQKAYYIFYKDNVNVTFSIKPILQEEYEAYLQGQTELQGKQDKIEKNNYNASKRYRLSEEDKIKKYVENYQQNVKYNIEEAYNLLNEKYRAKRFENIEKYKQYLKNTTPFGTLKKYRAIQNGEKMEYICIDENNNYYIFTSTSAFEYDVMLDLYTINTTDFLQRYNEASENEKVLMNLEKVSNAIAVKDYEYVYNKLDETFKQTNYKTLQDFQKYIKEKYDINNEITYNTYEEVTGVSVIYGTIKNETKNQESNIKIIMKMKDGTDFVMSFGKLQ